MGIFLDAIGQAFTLLASADREVLSITLLSLRVSLTAVILSTIIALPLAFYLNQHSFLGKKILISIIHTGMAMPPVVVGLVVYLFLSRNGALGYLDILYTPTAMIIAQMLLAIPIIIGISMAAMHAVEKKIGETIISLGATRLQLALKVIKEAKRGIITALITSFGAAVSEVGAIIIVGGNIRFHTRALTTGIVLETNKGNFAMAVALGIILILFAFLINFCLTYIQQRKVAADA